MVAILIIACCDLEKIIQTAIIAIEHVSLSATPFSYSIVKEEWCTQ